MNPETEEKQKNRPLNRKFLLRGLVICVFLALLPFAGMKAWKQSRFYFYKSLWEQNYQGDYFVYYSQYENGIEYSSSIPIADELIWENAENCLQSFGCEIIYSEEYYLPEFIYFHNASDFWIETANFINCADEVPHEDCSKIYD